ncbi:hypothetical protein ACFQ7B_05285 [Streptomyces erythrochromogenes]|uniref:hypothetical protein n=1 Tax=Streptomyces erythrochromogenes TaxID=285574 RepID=UPI003698B30A
MRDSAEHTGQPSTDQYGVGKCVRNTTSGRQYPEAKGLRRSMYLVHIHLWASPACGRLPHTTATDIAGCTEDCDGLLHVSVHPEPEDRPVVGVYLRAASLAEAEAEAVRLWRLAQTALPSLVGWTLLRAEVPLLPQALPNPPPEPST